MPLPKGLAAWDATPISLFNGVDGALAASVVTIFTGGVPLIYGSQEVGIANNIPFFSNSTINWNGNPDMLTTYQDMLAFYSDFDAARFGQNTFYSNIDVFCLEKSLDDSKSLIFVNMRDAIVDFSIPSNLHNTIWTDAFTNEDVNLSETITLNAFEYMILK